MERPIVELYDLYEDPNELTNLAEDPNRSEALAEMDVLLFEWLESVNDPILSGPVPTPYYLMSIESLKKSAGPGRAGDR